MAATKKATGMPVIHPLSDSETIRAQAEHIDSLYTESTGSYNRGVADAIKCLDMSIGLVAPEHSHHLEVVKILMQALLEVPSV